MNIPPEKLAKYKQRFEELDVDNTGLLSRESVAQILDDESDELEKLMIIILFEKYDIDHNGKIDFQEYLNFCSEMHQLTEKEILRTIFDFCDKDHNEKLDVDEIIMLGSQMGKKVTKSDAWATIRQFDINNDNTIDFNEFCAIIED